MNMTELTLPILLLCAALTQAQTRSTPLAVGDEVPDVTLRTEEGTEVSLRKLISEKPTVLIFYRGGWCPFCTRHLQALVGIEDNLNRAGAQMLAISMDQPAKLKETPDRDKLGYRLLSDSDAAAAKAFGIAFQVEKSLVRKYKESYQIDLEAASGRDHHILPHPAVYVADTNGRIRFADVNPDYRTRLEPAKILEAAKGAGGGAQGQAVTQPIFERVASQDFHPIRDGFTYDRHLDKHGVADLADPDWRVRLLAVRDLVRLGPPAGPALMAALEHTNGHVRHVAAMTLGILEIQDAASALERVLIEDPDEVVRAQAAVAVRQIGRHESLPVVRQAQAEDPSKDVRHQAQLAAYAIEHGIRPTPELAAAYAGLDGMRFNRVRVGEPAPDFELSDTEGRSWRLSAFRGEKPVVLIWIFADWCPVCHGEFRELIELREEFEAADIQVFTIQCHDLFPARVMVGKELEPDYWFSKTSFKEAYTQKIWWPHLADRAGAVGAEFGVQPMAFVVHAEWINRPAAIIVDRDGIVRLADYGTFWGDRPTIHQLLHMARTGDYAYTAPKRLRPASDR